MRAPRPFRRGELIARGYRVIELLRRGGAVDVYDAWSEERDCRCVIKALRPDKLSDHSARTALVREGQLLLRLSHPHLVRAYDLVRGRRPVLVLETLTGAPVICSGAMYWGVPTPLCARPGRRATLRSRSFAMPACETTFEGLTSR